MTYDTLLDNKVYLTLEKCFQFEYIFMTVNDSLSEH